MMEPWDISMKVLIASNHHFLVLPTRKRQDHSRIIQQIPPLLPSLIVVLHMDDLIGLTESSFL